MHFIIFIKKLFVFSRFLLILYDSMSVGFLALLSHLPIFIDVFEILIRPVNKDENVDASKEYALELALGQSNLDSTGLMKTVVIYQIPKYQAVTSQQYEESSKYWPVQFREDK